MSSAGIIEHSIPFDVLNDILTRFIILVPEAAKENLIRICFQVELAHWFYLDFYVANDERCKSCSLYEFSAHVFQHVPSLKSELARLPEILDEWREYKQNVPTYGAIILSEGLTHVLLVQSYWAKTSWGFPKGKVNEDEDPAHCAIREVREETGFDISPFLNPNDYLEAIINYQLVRLYVIKNIPKSTVFTPLTRCEIKACSWFSVADLPNNKKDATPKVKIGINPNSFFMVFPFMKRLKQICSNSHQGSSSSVRRYKQQKNTSFTEINTQTSGVLGSNNKAKEKINEEQQIKILKKREKKQSKRQLLFSESGSSSSSSSIGEFNAPSWTNFKFNMDEIMNCLT